MLNKIEQVVNKYPNQVAYQINNDSITYIDLWSSAKKYSELLKRQDSHPVIIYSTKNINVIILILACIMANRTYIPIGLYTPLNRLKGIIEDTKTSLVITDQEIKIDSVTCCKLDELKIFSNNEIKNYDNDFVYIIFTSGSTGSPKGVPISKQNLNNFISWISSIEPLCDYRNIKVLNCADFSFDLSVASLYYSLCNGHTLIDINSINDNNELLLFKDVDLAIMTPTFMKLCLLSDTFNYHNYPLFKCVYFCGEQLEVKTVKKILSVFPNLKIVNAYGPTEATSAVSSIIIDEKMLDEQQILPVGKVGTFATNIYIINGEIVLKGESVFNGYLNANSKAYYKEKNENCYKTGDLGYIKNGKLYCIGRKDNQIKYKGYRIELGDIEYNINQIPCVDQCVVIAKYDDNHNVKTLKAFIVLNRMENIDNIKVILQNKIPKYMIPKTIKIIEKLPINQNGKIDRKVLETL